MQEVPGVAKISRDLEIAQEQIKISRKLGVYIV
jgi:hypothetical protein